MVIFCSNTNGDEISICLVPTEIQTDGNNNEDMDGAVIIEDGAHSVTVGVGPSLLDGSWQNVWIDLVDTVQKANGMSVPSDPNDYLIRRVDSIQGTEGIFRLDNIIMRAKQTHNLLKDPRLFKMGLLYAQVFEPFRYLFVADYNGPKITVLDKNSQASEINRIADLMLNPNNFLLVEDSDDPDDPGVKYWTDLGTDPNLFGQNDPNMAELFGKYEFAIDQSLPIFFDSELQMTKSGPGSLARQIIDQGTLEWTINACYGWAIGHSGCIEKLQLLPIDPFDGMPTYLPTSYAVNDVLKTCGRPYYSPQLISLPEGALWNAGVTLWPNIAVFDHTSKAYGTYELYLEVTNGVQSDSTIFFLDVVNYPMENYDPAYQLSNQELVYYIGDVETRHITFIDPDCFIFSTSMLGREIRP